MKTAVPAKKTVHVAAAVLTRADGAFLLTQRPQGKAFAGYWEFPGGKIENGETPAAALRRELNEELGITVTEATPWRKVHFSYPHAEVELHFFHVTAWYGEPRGCEGQQCAWQTLAACTVAPLLPANNGILAALPELFAASVRTGKASGSG